MCETRLLQQGVGSKESESELEKIVEPKKPHREILALDRLQKFCDQLGSGGFKNIVVICGAGISTNS
eukprot:Pgem_evm1s432